MKHISLLLFLMQLLLGCSSPKREEKPSWVNGIRTGEESLKVPYGNKSYYRRIAGNKNFKQQTACDLAIQKAEEDIKKEYPNLSKIPYSVVVMYYDEEHQDCAVTLSVNAALEQEMKELALAHEQSLKHKQELSMKSNPTPDEVAEILKIRAEIAKEYALNGLDKNDFEKFSGEKVTIHNGHGPCSPVFQTDHYSLHGSTTICWASGVIKGYCTQVDGVCWTRNP